MTEPNGHQPPVPQRGPPTVAGSVGDPPKPASAASAETDARTGHQQTVSESGDEAAGLHSLRPVEISAGSQLGPYQIVRQVGQGGMGAVFEARHTKLKKTVAVKVLPPKLSQSALLISRFEREMEAVGKLDHPHIVRAMDAGEFQGTHFLVMEYVEGRDLSVMVKERGPRSVIEACEMIRQAAVGLAHAHQHGMVHRDIKPGNLFATKQSVIKILDLGLALAQGDQAPDSDAGALTVMGQFLGTPDYMAPEQWENSHTADGRADLYSLGCTLFFLLTGRAPYSDDEHHSMASKMRGHTTEPIPDLRAARREAIANRPKLSNDPLPDEVEALYRRLMAKQPADRIDTADELAKTLQEIVKSLRTTSGSTDRSSVNPLLSGTALAAGQSQGTAGPSPSNADSSQRKADSSQGNVAPTTPVASAIPFKEATPADIPTIIDPPDADTETDEFPFTKELSEPTLPASPATQRAKKSGKSASASGRSGSFKTLGLYLGGLAAVVLCGVIIVKITKKDGSVTEIPATGDKQQAASASSENSNLKSEISNLKSESSAQQPATDPSDLGPIDFAAERMAAEWVLARKGGVHLADEKGQVVSLIEGQIPPTPFVVKVVQLPIKLDLTDDELANLAGCRRLEWVNFAADPQITIRGLDSLRGVRSLRRLEVASTAVGDDLIARLSDWPQLESLDLQNCPISDGGLAQLPVQTRLKEILVKSRQISDAGLRSIAELCPNLEVIGCAKFSSNQRLTLLPLADLRLLQEVHCSGDQLNDDGLSILLDLPRLQRMRVTSPTTDAFIGQLVKLRDKLTALYVQSNVPGEVGLTAAGYDSIRQLHELTELWVEGHAGAPTDAVLRLLAELPNLQILKLAFTEEKLRPYTSDGINAFRELRPDVRVRLTGEGKDYPPTKSASEVVIPKRAEVPPAVPVEPDKPAAGAAKTAVAKAGKSELVAVKVPRVEIPAAPLPTKPNKAISNRATVSLPPPIAGLRGWSLEVGGHTGSITGLAYSPDGQSIGSVGAHDDTVRLWKISEVADAPVLTLDRVLLGEEGSIQDVAWSPDGFTLATTSYAGQSVTLFDVPTGRFLKRLALVNGVGRSVAWSPDGRLIAAAHRHRLGLIDPIRGVVRLSQTPMPLQDGCWSPDGSQIATVDEVGGIKFWKPQTLTPVAEFDSAERGLLTVAWSPDGKWVATGGVQGVIKIWEAATKKRLLELRPEQGQILGLSWEPATSGTLLNKHAAWPRLASVGSEGGKLVVWDTAKGDKLLSTKDTTQYSAVAWSPDGTQIALARFNVVELRDSVTGKRIATTENFGRPRFVNAMSDLSASGKQLRIQQKIQQKTELTVWEADTGIFVKRVENLPNGQSLASPTDEWLAVFDPNSPEGNLHLVDTATYQNHRALLGHGSTITAVNWSNDGKTLASSSKDQTVRLWNAESGEQLLSIPHPNAVQSVVWSPDGKRLATCGNDDIIRLWLAPTGKVAGEFPRLPFACAPSPSGLAWSADEKYLAIAGIDGATRVLDLKSGKPSDPILQFGIAAMSVAWSGDSKQLLSGSGGEVGYRTLTAREGTVSYGYGWPVQWHPDRRRFLTGMVGYFPLQGLDAKRDVKIGSLYPSIVGGHHVCISADGHYRGSNGIEQHIVYVALTKEGHQQTYSPADFAAKFNWKNDPTKAVLLGR